MNLFDCYKILGCYSLSTDAEIKTAHRRLSREHHPDKGGDIEKFDKVQKAFKEVATAADRRNLLIKLTGLGSPCGACDGRGYQRRQKSFVNVITTPCHVCDGCGMISHEARR